MRKNSCLYSWFEFKEEKGLIMTNLCPLEELQRVKIVYLKKKNVSSAFVSKGASKNLVKKQSLFIFINI